MELHALRGLRDKIPKGQYVLRMSVFDQLAGKPMEWQGLGNKGEEKWYTALAPRFHNGEYDSMSMDLNTSLYTVAPAPKAMKPSYVLIFQLFLLRGNNKPKTKEVIFVFHISSLLLNHYGAKGD